MTTRYVFWTGVALLVAGAVLGGPDGIVPGEIWADDNGVHVNAHGGGVLEEDGVYWWYGEDKGPGSAGNRADKGVHVYSSRDLVNWKDEGLALDVRGHRSGDLAGGPSVVERPKVLRSSATGKYVMYFHLVRKGEDYYNSRTGIAVADQPGGPFVFVKSVRPNPGKWPLNARPEDCTEAAVRKWAAFADWTMPDWSEKTLDFIRKGNIVAAHFGKGQLAQDQTLFRDEDGKTYHVYASEFDATLHIAELEDDLLGYTGRYWRALEGTWTEAPAICRRDGWYYLLGSGCSGWKPNAARCFRARSLAGPWESLGNPCRGVNPQNGLGPEKTWGCQSTFLLPDPARPGSFIAMFDMWRPKNAIDGRYVWLPVEFSPEGRMVIEWRDAWRPQRVGRAHVSSGFDVAAKRAFVCDLDGTLFVGAQPIRPAVDYVIANTKSGRFRFFYLTNNTSKTPGDFMRKLLDAGIPVTPDQVLTPLVTLESYIREKGYRSVYPLASGKVVDYLTKRLSDVGTRFEYSPERNELIALTFDRELTYEKLACATRLWNMRNGGNAKTGLRTIPGRPGIDYVMTHPDNFCPSEEGPIPDIGGMARILETTNGMKPTHVFGKPSPTLLAPVLAQFKPEEIAVVGDRLYTDKAIADNAGVDFVCVLSGETTPEGLKAYQGTPPAVVVETFDRVEGPGRR